MRSYVPSKQCRRCKLVFNTPRECGTHECAMAVIRCEWPDCQQVCIDRQTFLVHLILVHGGKYPPLGRTWTSELPEENYRAEQRIEELDMQ